jgi:hypothetical protein
MLLTNSPITAAKLRGSVRLNMKKELLKPQRATVF